MRLMPGVNAVQVITQDKYYGSSSVSTVVGHGPNFMYLQQGEGTYAPGSYQKVEWTWDATTSKWYMCTSSHGHATLDAVVLHSTAGVHLHNATHDQCGAFSNSVLSPLTLDVAGSWVDNWGAYYVITQDKYYGSSSVSTVVGHGPNFMYLQQGEGTYAPGSYQKVEWTWDATTSKWYMCTSSHGHATLDAVVLHSTAGVHLHNATHDQCGAFSNSVLSPLTLDVAGSWVDNWGAYYVITQDKYYGSSSVSTVVGHGPNFMYLQQGEGTYAPGSYQKVEWTWDATTSKWYMCTSSHGHATLDAVVLHSTAGVHLHNATHDQCGAFSNSVLSPLTLDVTGSWVDNFGKFHMFASNVWYAGVNNVTYSTSGIIGFGPNYMFVIKGEGTNASGTYEKVEWTWHSNSSIWYMCTTTHGHASLDAAVLRSTLGVHVGNRSQDKCGDVLNTVMYPVSFSFNPVAKLISSIQN
ncbi:hypothetical protein AB1Y20_012219 [Prymnesium parvum]|uniref:Uncharacterized protein n=1 Tax=Prymnesium parvum TaxID=97485 RepID=A0AB34INS9_PRYPA